MKLTFKHTALSLALAGSFALTGCNFIGDGDAVFTDPSMNVAFSGSAIKGPLKDADVSAYEVDDLNTAIATQIPTNAQGQYSFNADVSNSVIIDVVGNANSFFVCDIPAGCGVDNQYAVGEDVPAEGVTLSTVAYVENGQATSTTQANVISTIAATIVRQNPSFQSNSQANKARLNKVIFDLLGLSDSEQNGLDVFSLNLVAGNNLGATQSAALKKLSAFNASFAKLTAGQTVGSLISGLATAVNNVATATTQEEAQAALNTASEAIVAGQEKAKEIDSSLDFEAPEFEYNGEDLTGTGTGTGSGSNSGGLN
ncbi:hypothetical protein N7931_11860 [Catenovulum sp. 2E275]|uniref:hypothetical protein n=1 Tax=Catenovulum sp. 2E275 TaxID=2980497 RepID=UPI0021D0722E|nr:hypothetical protein [Catenovulum sp. 2E275]MCU4676322.1 hypothetical protein [Catenovulum sp. 2E275]